ncbi:hypothetical protein GCM10010507_19030 [Streptomyces cinnamoneus]|uniref:Uncharacterized protein n=1 Tax=Streptomyces cinnamoneus TaxID=53446 RepID=A0A918WGG9_STRCJ|nr:hypothetical protein GCM10010507_19030 [Streptomyces cinnamoneus]
MLFAHGTAGPDSARPLDHMPQELGLGLIPFFVGSYSVALLLTAVRLRSPPGVKCPRSGRAPAAKADR